MKHGPLFHEIDTRFQYPFGHVSTQYFRVFLCGNESQDINLIGFDVQKSKLVTEVRSSAVRSENGKNSRSLNFISIFMCYIINMYFLNDRLFENCGFS
jgi:hypothetical protein